MSETETAIEELTEREDAAESMEGDDTQRQRERKKQDKEIAEDKTGHGKDGADPEKNQRLL